MIAIDTNVLLRYLLKDNTAQYQRARKLIQDNKPILITDIVLVEMFWTLRGKKYHLQPSELVIVLEAIFAEENFLFENNQLMWQVLSLYRNSIKNDKEPNDFADILIAIKAKYLADKDHIDFGGFYTFDSLAQRLPSAKAP